MASSDQPPALPRERPRDLPGGRSTRRVVLTAVLVVALVVAAGAVAGPAASLWGRHSADADRERLTGVATEVALLLSSLSANDAEASLDRLTDLSTGGFREEVTGRRAEVLRLVDDDDEVRSVARVVASGVEQDVAPRGFLGGGGEPARARLLVAVRSEVSNARTEAGESGPGRRDGGGERLWRWRLEAVIEDGRAVVSSAEVAV